MFHLSWLCFISALCITFIFKFSFIIRKVFVDSVYICSGSPHVITHVTSLNTRQEEKAHGRGCFFALLYVLKLGHGSQCIIKVHFGCTSNIRA